MKKKTTKSKSTDKKKLNFVIVGDNNFWYAMSHTTVPDKRPMTDIIEGISKKIANEEYSDHGLPQVRDLIVFYYFDKVTYEGVLEEIADDDEEEN